MENNNIKALKKFRECFIPIYTVITLVFIICACYLACINVIDDLIINVCICMISVGGVLVWARFFISFKDIKFDRNFVKITLEKIKYSAFSEVYISENRVLSLRSDAQKVIIETTLRLYNEDQIEQIIKEFMMRKKTVIDNRSQPAKEKTKFYTEDILPIIGLGIIFGIAFIVGILTGLSESEEWPLILICSFVVLYSIYSTYKSGISINDKNIRIQGNNFIPKTVFLPSVSRAKIEEDNNLIFYNSANEAEDSFDLSKMRNNDAQKFINILSRKVPLSIAPEIAREKNYTSEYAIKETSQTTNRRRTVIKTAEVQPIKQENKITQFQRNIELGSQSDTNKNRTKRRLEL